MIGFLFPFLLIVHVFLCLFLILLVLVQSDKGGGLAGALGGMGGGAAFTGASAATFLTKLTQTVAIISFVVILALNALSVSKDNGGTVESELKSSNSSLNSVIPAGYDGSGSIPGLPAQAQPPAAPVQSE
jgi:preprotein translocase subunit SecG